MLYYGKYTRISIHRRQQCHCGWARNRPVWVREKSRVPPIHCQNMSKIGAYAIMVPSQCVLSRHNQRGLIGYCGYTWSHNQSTFRYYLIISTRISYAAAVGNQGPVRQWSVMAWSPPRIGNFIPILVQPMNRALGGTQVGHLKCI